jgi:hypothetical protein
VTDSDKTQAVQTAVETVFSRLPRVFRTAAVKLEITKQVARCNGDYGQAARQSVLGMFASIDSAIARGEKLVNAERNRQSKRG